MDGSYSTIAMRRGMAATIAEGSALEARCHRFARILRRFARPRPAMFGFGPSNALHNTEGSMETQKQPRPALPLLALLALASALGIAVAIALAGVAMLLAAPAYAAQSEAKEGMLFLRARGADPVAAPLLATEVTFRVSGPVARAHVVQTFRNPHDVWYEGFYVFPLPESGACDRLRLVVG